MSDQGDGAIKNLGVFSALQAATDTKFFLISASFTLLVDNILLALNQYGLLELATNKKLLEDSNITFQAVLIFIVFSFLTSIVLPIAAGICDFIYALTVGWLFTKISSAVERLFGSESAPFQREHNKVTLFELKKEAHESKEKYYLDLYKEAEAERKTWWDNMFRFALYSFACLTMLVVNFYLAHIGKNTISKFSIEFFNSTTPVWFFIVLLAGMFFWRLYDKSEPNWIDCPSLYDKIASEKKKYY